MSFYLEKINQTYYFRLRIPKDLLPYLGVSKIRKSLKTKNYSDAKTLVRGYLYATEKLFVAIRSNMLTPNQISDVINDWKAMYLANMKTARRKATQSTFLPTEFKYQLSKGDLSLSTKETTEAVIDSYKAQREHYNELILTNSFEDTIRFAKGLLRRKGIDVDLTAEEAIQLSESLLMARIEICDVMIARMQGNYNCKFRMNPTTIPA